MSIASWLVDRCVVSRYVGRDGHGDKVFAPSETVACRYEQATAKVRDADGDERVSADQLATAEPIGLNDRVWLPGKDPDVARQAKTPISVKNARSKDGARLTLNMTFF
jgi:hypothetical protein